MKKAIFLCLFIYISVLNSFSTISQNNSNTKKAPIRLKYSCFSSNNLSEDNPESKEKEWQSFYKEKNTVFFTSHLAVKPNESFKLKKYNF